MKKKLLTYFSGIFFLLIFIVSLAIIFTNRINSDDILMKDLKEATEIVIGVSEKDPLNTDKSSVVIDNTELGVFSVKGELIKVLSDGSNDGTLSTDILLKELNPEQIYSEANEIRGTKSGVEFYGYKETLPNGEYLVAVKSFRTVFDPGNLMKQIILGALFIIPLGLFLIYNAVEKIMEPIGEMKEATSRIAYGELNSRVTIKENGDLSEIINNFNSMADRLESTIVDTLDKQNQLEAILTSMNSGVIATDNKKKIIIFNPYAKKLFGIFGDVIGKNLNDVMKGIDLKELMTVKQDFTELNLGAYDQTTIRYKTAVLMSDNKDSSGYVTVLQDVSDLKKLEQIRSQFVANVSHELKTPLTSIKGFSETLRFVEDEKTKNKFLDIIDQEAERLRRLIEDILSLSAIENQKSLAVEIVNASEVVKETCSLLELSASEKNIDFALIIKGDPLFIGDSDKFKQMIINLVDNAIKYTDQNGKVKVRLEEQKEYMTMTVSDTGTGIPAEHIPRLFERFYRVDKSRDRAKGGTGLGLAIVKHIVLGFGGTIEVFSEEGKGTSFTVKIPLYKEDSDNVSRKIQSIKFNE